MNTQDIKFPRFVPHPWEYLKDFLTERNISKKKFAEIIEKTPSEIKDIIEGKEDINADLAMRFSIVFRTPPELWLNMKIIYDLYQLNRLKEKEADFTAIKKRSLAFA